MQQKIRDTHSHPPSLSRARLQYGATNLQVILQPPLIRTAQSRAMPSLAERAMEIEVHTCGGGQRDYSVASDAHQHTPASIRRQGPLRNNPVTFARYKAPFQGLAVEGVHR